MLYALCPVEHTHRKVQVLPFGADKEEVEAIVVLAVEIFLYAVVLGGIGIASLLEDVGQVDKSDGLARNLIIYMYLEPYN